MALSKCRECGKDVSTEAEVCPYCGVGYPVMTIYRQYRLWIILALLGALGFGFWLYTIPSEQDEEAKAESALIEENQADVGEAVVNKSDRAVVVDLYKQGKNAVEISKTTRIRVDEVRRILKEYKKEQDAIDRKP